jgi:hypothetical protein
MVSAGRAGRCGRIVVVFVLADYVSRGGGGVIWVPDADIVRQRVILARG